MCLYGLRSILKPESVSGWRSGVGDAYHIPNTWGQRLPQHVSGFHEYASLSLRAPGCQCFSQHLHNTLWVSVSNLSEYRVYSYGASQILVYEYYTVDQTERPSFHKRTFLPENPSFSQWLPLPTQLKVWLLLESQHLTPLCYVVNFYARIKINNMHQHTI